MKLITTLTILVAAACGGGSTSSYSEPNAARMEVEEMGIEESGLAYGDEDLSVAQKRAEENYEQKIIKTGNVYYRVEDALEEYDRVVKILPGFKAYLASENQSESYDRINYDLTIKVPPQNFDSLLNHLIKNRKVDSKYVNIDDVTDQYYDLKSRIENKKKLEERYQEILNKATSIKDILEIERNLNQVRTEIESLQGQLKLLSYRIDFSTLDVRFYQILPYKVDNQQRPGFGARFVNSLKGGWEGFLTFIVFMVRLWPFALLLVIVLIIVRNVQAKRAKKKDD